MDGGRLLGCQSHNNSPEEKLDHVAIFIKMGRHPSGGEGEPAAAVAECDG